MQISDLDRAGTKVLTSFAVKDSRQRDGDEPVNDEQKSWLRSLMECWVIWQRTDLTCNYPCQEPHERNHPVLHVHWYGTSCANRISYGHSQRRVR